MQRTYWNAAMHNMMFTRKTTQQRISSKRGMFSLYIFIIQFTIIPMESYAYSVEL